VSAKRDDAECDEELARLGPAEFFGEIGLLTGEASGVRLTALTPVSVYELAGAELARIRDNHPELSQALTRVVTFRQAAVKPPEDTDSGDDTHSHGLRGWLSDWVRHRYDIAASR
jgi:CRP-like cAMP-binding protein